MMAGKNDIGIEKLGSRRNLAIDGLRGFCLLLMTMDHLPGNPMARVSNWRYGPFGFFTAASGFVLLSGWVTGQVYGRYRQARGGKAVIRRILHRMAKLYLAQLILISGVCIAVELHWRGTFTDELVLFRTHPLKALLMGIALLQQPEYLGILPMYFFFLVLAPLVLWQVQTGHRWRVVFLSGAVWLITGLIFELPNNSTGVNFGFNPLSYQLLFVIGMVLGEARFQLESFKPQIRKLMVVSSFALAAMFFALRLGYAFLGSVKVIVDRRHSFFSLDKMGPLRVLSFAVFAVVLAWILQKKKLINTNNAPSRWLILLGQNSLAVFVWSILLTYAITAVLPANASVGLRIADFFFASASLTIPAWLSSWSTGEMRLRAVPFTG
jgi:hypothetical protein